ncbi:unnamed protein product [Penicillium salamii]|uniref:Thymocyte nuclear protein 1 n=1 Tax=Penicillium salamii TaxID=1612424 RepID=A0A9W4NF49_9EURO|nr:unnamed protein product [Penicillium salamii]
MPFKRKTESAMSASEATATPSKRIRTASAATPGSAGAASASATTPQTGEKRGRGRPRKNPEDLAPKPVYDGPKRGRGRPRKTVSETEVEAATPSSAKKGRGRPRKDSGEPATATPQAETTATPQAKKKDGRGRPRKDAGGAKPTTPVTKKKDGRGRPRKTPLANGKAEPEAASESDSPTPPTAALPAVNIDTDRSFWLMKAEPESRMEKGKDVKFSIDDLAAAEKPEPWDAKNLMRDMKKGDYAFFYHSNCKVPGIVGVMEIVQEHSVDESAFDSEHPYFDAKSKRSDPRWVVVHVEYRRKLEKQVTLEELKTHSKAGKSLESLQMIKQGRLSVSSVTPAQWQYILGLAGEEPQEEFTKLESSDQEGDQDDDQDGDSHGEQDGDQDNDQDADKVELPLESTNQE